MTNLQGDARVLADFIQSLSGFRMIEAGPDYEHMGAILADAVLQSGVNYETVVAPKVQHILETYPDARTLPLFQKMIEDHGANHVLQWSDDVKPSRLLRLMYVLADQGISTHQDLNRWLRLPESRKILLAIKGIGPKTVDYLGILVGIDGVAVDIHLMKFLHAAGIEHSDYETAREIISSAADLLKVSRRTLDHSIWTYQSAAP